MTHRHRIGSAVAVLAWLPAGCARDGLPPGALKPVDCDVLPAATSDVVAAAEASDAPIIDSDLSAGETQVLVRWTDSKGQRWLQNVPTTSSTINYKADGLKGEWWPLWGVWVQLPCHPGATTGMWFALMDGTYDPLTPGNYPIAAIGFDVPDREQSDGDVRTAEGIVTITEAGDGVASGFMTGMGGSGLISNFTGKEIGIEYLLHGLAFKSIPADWVSGDEE